MPMFSQAESYSQTRLHTRFTRGAPSLLYPTSDQLVQNVQEQAILSNTLSDSSTPGKPFDRAGPGGDAGNASCRLPPTAAIDLQRALSPLDAGNKLGNIAINI